MIAELQVFRLGKMYVKNFRFNDTLQVTLTDKLTDAKQNITSPAAIDQLMKIGAVQITLREVK